LACMAPPIMRAKRGMLCERMNEGWQKNTSFMPHYFGHGI